MSSSIADTLRTLLMSDPASFSAASKFFSAWTSGSLFFPKDDYLGVLKSTATTCAGVWECGWVCGCMLGGWRWGSLAGSGPGRILKKILDPVSRSWAEAVSYLKIDHWSILLAYSAYPVIHPALAPRIRFYLHKEFRAAGIRIFSTQRIGAARMRFYLHKLTDELLNPSIPKAFKEWSTYRDLYTTTFLWCGWGRRFGFVWR